MRVEQDGAPLERRCEPAALREDQRRPLQRCRTSRTGQRSQRGATLLEALIGFLVVSVGWLAVAQMQSRLRQGTDHARQHAEAGRLAQQQFERLRARVSSAPPDDALDTTADARTSAVEVDATDTRYRIELSQRPGDVAALDDVQVDVRWADATGADQRLRLSGMLHAQSAALALPLAAGRRDRAGRVGGRHAAIPREAVDRGDGRSIFKPAADSTQAWLFDNRTARIVARCTTSADSTPAELGGADLSACRDEDRLLLAGTLRVAPEAGSDPLRAEVALQRPDGGPADADCIGEVVRGVDAGTAGMPRAIAVSVAARPADHGLAAWRELGDRFVRYHCAVAAQAVSSGGRPQWGGRLAITPSGWTIGITEGTYRVCRHSSDTDGSGAIDRPAEAPEVYRAVDDALAHQNFVRTLGTRPCPDDSVSPGAGTATVPHQP